MPEYCAAPETAPHSPGSGITSSLRRSSRSRIAMCIRSDIPSSSRCRNCQSALKTTIGITVWRSTRGLLGCRPIGNQPRAANEKPKPQTFGSEP